MIAPRAGWIVAWLAQIIPTRGDTEAGTVGRGHELAILAFLAITMVGGLISLWRARRDDED